MFIIVILCFTGAIKSIVNGIIIREKFFNSVVEEDYLQSESYIRESEHIISDLTRLIGEYKNEEHILNGGTISEVEIRKRGKYYGYHEYFHSRSKYNPN